MANVVMASKPKRIRTFIINGQVYEGGMEQYYSGQATPAKTTNTVEPNLGGATTPDGLPE